MTGRAVDLLESSFSAEARSARDARLAVRRCLGSVDRSLVEEIELLTSEVFADAAATVSGHGNIRIKVRQEGRSVRVEVVNEQPYDDAAPLVSPQALDADVLERLLDAFSTDWGRSSRSHGETATWFEMAVTR